MKAATQQQLSKRVASILGQPVTFVAVKRAKVISTRAVIQEGIDPFSPDQLNTSVNDLKTVITILTPDIGAVERGDEIRTEAGAVYVVRQELERTAGRITVIVK